MDDAGSRLKEIKMQHAYVVGDNVNESALAEFSELLRQAYEHGEESGGTMDWNDVQAALKKAVDALGAPAQQFMAVANIDGFDEDPIVACSPDASLEAKAAAQLIYAYRNPQSVDWEDVDLAWETLLLADVENGLSPAHM